MDELFTALNKTLTSNQDYLNESLAYFQQISSVNYPWLISALAQISCSQISNCPAVCHQAAIQLKNLIKTVPSGWSQLNNSAKNNIKETLLRALSTREASSTGVSQCVHAVAELELAGSGWVELVPTLLHTSTSPAHSLVAKLRTIETVGYICETVSAELVEHHVNDILTSIVTSIGNHVEGRELTLAALGALTNALQFAAINFARVSERNYLVQVICECTQYEDVEIRVVALQCLARTLHLYYPVMEDYLEPAVWPISMNAISDTHDILVMQGLEVINSMCEAEQDLVEEGDTPSGWIHNNLHLIVPPLIRVLVRDGGVTSADWTTGKGVQVCIRLLAQLTGNLLLPHILPFIQAKLVCEEEELVGAALLSLAGLMDGPDLQYLLPTIQTFLDLLEKLLSCGKQKVRQSGVLVLSQLCQLHAGALRKLQQYELVLQAVVSSLASSDPVVVEQCCWCLVHLLERKEGEMDGSENKHMTFIYLPCLEFLVNITQPGRQIEVNLLYAAYLAMTAVIERFPGEGCSELQPLARLLIARLTTLHGSLHQEYIFCPVEALLRLLEVEHVLSLTSDLVTFASSILLADSSRNKEESVNLLSLLVDKLEWRVLQYSQNMLASLIVNLERSEDGILLECCLGLAGDLYRCAGDAARSLHADHATVISCILRFLGNCEIERRIKPVCVCTLADLVLCVPEAVIPFTQPIMQMLLEAGHACSSFPSAQLLDLDAGGELVGVIATSQSREDVISTQAKDAKFFEELGKAVVDALAALVQALSANLDAIDDLKEKYLDNVLNMIRGLDFIFHQSEEILTALCGLLGDLFKSFGDLELEDGLGQILERGSVSVTPALRRIAVWASGERCAASSSASAVKRSRMSAGTSESYSMRVTLSCTGQYITQQIEEEKVTVSLRPLAFNTNCDTATSHTPSVIGRDENSNHVEATVTLPFKPVNSCSVDEGLPAGDDINQLRRLRKKRAAAVALDLDGGKKSRDSESEYWF